MSRTLRSIAFLTAAVFASLSHPVVAGDVTGAVAGGTLTLTGGAGAEIITIDQVGVANAKEFRVSPGAGTTIGGVAAPQTFSGVSKDIVLQLGDGADDITITGCAPRRDVVFNGGTTGAQVCSITGKTVVKDDVTATTAGAQINLRIDGSNVKDDVRYTGGAGQDQLHVFGAARIGGDVVATLGAESDQFDIIDSLVKGKVDCDGGPDNDEFEFAVFSCDGNVGLTDSSGNNALGMDSCDIEGALKVTFGGGNDSAELEDVFVRHPTTLTFGDGSNAMSADLVHVLGAFKINGGANVDHIHVFDTCFIDGDLKVLLGDGDNTIDLEDFAVLGTVKLNTGAGHDMIQFAESYVGGDVRVEPSTAAGAMGDGVSIVGCAVNGSVRVKAAGDVAVAIENTSIAKNATGTLSGATNAFNVDDTNMRQLSITGAGGVETVQVGQGTNVRDDATLDLGDGDNVLKLLQIVIQDDLKVRTGAGNDTLDFTGAVIGGNSDVDTGSGTDVGP